MALPARSDAGLERSEQQREPSGPLRRCIVSGETLPKDKLVRFVVGPDGAIVPDLAEVLPGRGIWVRAIREALEKACVRGTFARAARRRVAVEPDLVDEVERQLRARALNILGLARRSGMVITGFEKVRGAAGAEGALLQITAFGRGGSSGSPSARSDSADINTLFTSDELSQALGRENVVHVALRPSSIAERFSKSCDRLAGIKRPQPSPASPAPVSELTDATYREEIE